jgi:hypothetical protein
MLNFREGNDSFKRHVDPSLLICELPWLSDIREASSSLVSCDLALPLQDIHDGIF